MYIVLLGAPGSGKGTQAKLLEREFNIVHLSTGELFRAILADESHPLYGEVQVVKEGKLVSDDVVNKVVEDGLTSERFKSGAILDGYPRTVSQAEALDGILANLDKGIDVVIDLDVEKGVLFKRLLGRRVCPKCKRIFSVKDGIDICPDCNVGLIIRDDDNEQVIEKRFKEYKEKTAPLQDYYTASGAPYIKVEICDVDKSPEEVQQIILDQLKKIDII